MTLFEYKLQDYISQLTFLPLSHSLPTILCGSSEYEPLWLHYFLWLISCFFHNSAIYWKQFLTLFISNCLKLTARMPKEILGVNTQNHGESLLSYFHHVWELFEHLSYYTSQDYKLLKGRGWDLPSSYLLLHPMMNLKVYWDLREL